MGLSKSKVGYRGWVAVFVADLAPCWFETKSLCLFLESLGPGLWEMVFHFSLSRGLLGVLVLRICSLFGR